MTLGQAGFVGIHRPPKRLERHCGEGCRGDEREPRQRREEGLDHVLVSGSVEAVERPIHCREKELGAFPVKPVEVDGNGWSALEPGQENKEGQGGER